MRRVLAILLCIYAVCKVLCFILSDDSLRRGFCFLENHGKEGKAEKRERRENGKGGKSVREREKPLSYTITGGAARHEKVKPKTWRILASADAIWFLRLEVFTTDQPRCYAFDKVLCPPGFYRKKLWLSCFRDKSSRKKSFFSLVDPGTCKNSEKMFLLTGKSCETSVVLPG